MVRRGPALRALSIVPLLVGVALAATACGEGTTGPSQEQFVATLGGTSEVPPVTTGATGSATFTRVHTDSMRFSVTVNGLDNFTMTHIHVAPAGQNGPIVVWLRPEAPPPMLVPGTSSGIIAEGTFTPANFVGEWAGESMDAVVDVLRSGGAYVNVHTQQNPGGEIRGQIAEQ